MSSRKVNKKKIVCNQFTHLKKEKKKKDKKTNNEEDDTHFQQLLFLSIIAHTGTYQLSMYTQYTHTHTYTHPYIRCIQTGDKNEYLEYSYI